MALARPAHSWPRRGQTGDESVKGVVSMTVARPAQSWPRRGHTTVPAGDQREPVVKDGNVPVPRGGECAGTTRAAHHITFQSERGLVRISAGEGDKRVNQVTCLQAPVAGCHTAFQSEHGLVRISQRDYGAKPGVGRSHAERDEGLPRVTGTLTPFFYPVWVCLVHPVGVFPPHNAFSVEKRGGTPVTQGRRPAPLRSASRQPWAVLHNPVGISGKEHCRHSKGAAFFSPLSLPSFPSCTWECPCLRSCASRRAQRAAVLKGPRT